MDRWRDGWIRARMEECQDGMMLGVAGLTTSLLDTLWKTKSRASDGF